MVCLPREILQKRVCPDARSKFAARPSCVCAVVAGSMARLIAFSEQQALS